MYRASYKAIAMAAIGVNISPRIIHVDDATPPFIAFTPLMLMMQHRVK